MNNNIPKPEFRIKLGIFELGIPVYFKRKKPVDPATIVVNRFLQIFKDHGVSISQIPRLIPQVTLDKLKDTETLLQALTNEVIEQTANLFLIRRAWLEGVSDRIYDYRWCYKSPRKFYEDLSEQRIDNIMWPIMVFCRSEKINYKGWREQPLVLVPFVAFFRFD